MTDGWLVALIAGTWLVIGLVLAVLMGRRGHGAWGWFVLGTVMGPFAVALAADALRKGRGVRSKQGRRGAVPSTFSSGRAAVAAVG